MLKQSRIYAGVLGVVAGLLCSALPVAAQVVTGPIVRREVHHDTSQPLRDLARLAPPPSDHPKHEAEPWRRIPLPAGMDPNVEDTVVQRTAGPSTPAVNLSFDGLGQGQYGFGVGVAPPDTNGAPGATQYVQWVNDSYAVFNKTTGALVMGPVAGNTLWNGFGGACQTNNAGDPIVQYDKLAGRWILSQFTGRTAPFLQCIAVSTGPDATGTYNRYSFQYNNFNDYPKVGVWPDGYYTTFNMFNGNTFLGSNTCAFDRSRMLLGQTATQVCFQQGSGTGSLLPADLDGLTTPPAGSPNFQMTFGNNILQLFKFHVDFTTPSNSTFTGPTNIAVAAFAALCGGLGTCVPQSGTAQQLDSLGDRLMYRLAYRNYGDHESLVVNHSVTNGVRWYEIQNPNGTPTVAQQSTFAPDARFRWMGSVAMDHVGNLAVGYSVSSGTLFPSIAFAGRVPTDPPSTLETEVYLANGAGSQTGGLSRWGDYSAMTVDPVDDCTFWYTQEYMRATGSFNWNTRIGNFRFPTCNTTPDFALSAAPPSLTITQGNSGTSTITVTDQAGFTGNVALSASGLPSGVTATFNPSSTTSTSTLTLATTFFATVGTSTVTITGTSGALTHTTPLTLTINAAPPPIATLTPSSLNFGSEALGVPVSQTLTLSNTGGSPLVITGIGVGGDYTQTNNCGGQVNQGSSCTITVTFNPTALGTRTATLTVVDNATPSMQTASVTGVGVSSVDFSLSASPSSLSIKQGNAGTSTITVNKLFGFSGTVALSASGLPSGVTASFNPTSTTGSSTLTLTASSIATVGSSTVTVTGTSGSLTRTTTIALTITSAGTPIVTLTPSSLSFGFVGVGGSSTQTVTLHNSGTGTLTITGIGVGSPFSQTNTCGGSVAAGGSCTITVTFHPTSSGSFGSQLTIVDNASPSLQMVLCTGTGG